MADKDTQTKDVEASTEVDSSKAEEVTAVEEEKSENGDTENGAEEKENSTEKSTKNGDDSTDKVCSIKRKSTGGDAAEETPAEGATPEKKAKLDEPAEAELNGDAEVAA